MEVFFFSSLAKVKQLMAQTIAEIKNKQSLSKRVIGKA
jgi:hypothetical protein